MVGQILDHSHFVKRYINAVNFLVLPDALALPHKRYTLWRKLLRYTSKGWYVGKTKMKDWKASVRTWEKNQRQKNKKSKDDEGLEGWLNA